MVRNRQRKTSIGSFSEDGIKNAIKLVQEGHSLIQAAAQAGLSFLTVFRYTRKLKRMPLKKG